jgi:pimeloyl-ACP methyl ester carboxylesterase
MPIASANSIELFYDEFGNRSAPAILLIMGFGAQMIEWPETFCEGLAKRGFRVVRFDNRDVGLSTKLDRGAPVDVAAAFARAAREASAISILAIGRLLPASNCRSRSYGVTTETLKTEISVISREGRQAGQCTRGLSPAGATLR